MSVDKMPANLWVSVGEHARLSDVFHSLRILWRKHPHIVRWLSTLCEKNNSAKVSYILDINDSSPYPHASSCMHQFVLCKYTMNL